MSDVPPAPNADLQRVSIRDFTPGIADTPGANYPPGQAQRTNTFRCIANRSGALTPLPARTIPFPLQDDNGSNPPGNYAIIGLYAPPITPLPNPGTPNPAIPTEHELFVGTEYVTGALHKHFLRRYRVYDAAGGGATFDTIESVSFADAGALIATGMGFCTTRSNRLAPTTPGHAAVIYGYFIGVGGSSYIHEFPDDQALASATPYVMETGVFSVYVVAHQGRVVVEDIQADNHGPTTFTFIGENVKWWPVNDVTAANVGPLEVFVPENPSSGLIMASMSANELFVVKQNSGYYISGDLNNPTVVTLPMVVGADYTQTPAVGRLGVVYGNRRSGVWQWQHGDTCNLLSPRLLPDFWFIDASFGGVGYQFAMCDDWLLTPNNWLYDSEMGGWWRLEDPSVAQIRLFTTFGEFIYGSQSTYTHSNLNGVFRWQRSVPATSYSWQSQPIWETVDQYVDVQEVVIRASGTGTVTVTLSNQQGHTQDVTFSIQSTTPKLYINNLALKGDDITIRIESASGSTAPAPTVWECHVGFRPAEGIARG